MSKAREQLGPWPGLERSVNHHRHGCGLGLTGYEFEPAFYRGDPAIGRARTFREEHNRSSCAQAVDDAPDSGQVGVSTLNREGIERPYKPGKSWIVKQAIAGDVIELAL